MRESLVFAREDLRSLEPKHAFFVGVDSDGCVFDTMELKQKQCFHKIIVSHWNLGAIEKYVRETAEFVNLYSIHRGNNRFVNLLITFGLLRKRLAVKSSGVKLPEFVALEAFVNSGRPLGNPTLEQAVGQTGDVGLKDVLAWSRAVNEDIERAATSVFPFKWVRESLAKIREHSDAICVSQTPFEALIREWREHGLLRYIKIIAGQELGTKTEQLKLATDGKYPPHRMLVIGDAPGDMRAARNIGALFYPINPGKEPESWRRFLEEAFDKFIEGTYSEEYEAGLIAGFNKLLPDTPSWME